MTSDHADARTFLSEHAPFDALPAELLDKLAQELELRSYPQGSTVLEIGVENHHLYIVKTGAVEVRGEGDELLARLGEGESFGYLSLLTGRQTVNRVTALEETQVYLLPEARFHALRHAYDELDRFFSQAHAERVQSAVARRRDLAENLAFLATHAGQLVGRPPVSLPPGKSIREAAQLMDRERVSSLLVVEAGRLVGMVTDRDLRSRVVAAGRGLEEPLERVMTRSLVSAQASDYAFEALLAMSRHNVHHLPVLAGDQLVGVLSATDLIQLQTAHPVLLVRDIYRQDDIAGLSAVSRRLPQLFCNLVEAEASAYDIGRVVTTVTDALSRRLLELAERKLGPPPVPYAWLVFGAEARQEQSLYTEQASALLLADEAAPQHEDYFAALARFVAEGLEACRGVGRPARVTATGPRWRRPLAAWRGTFEDWVLRPEPETLLQADSLLDMRPIFGETRLARELQQQLLWLCSENGVFSAYLARAALEHRPPLGFFRQFVLEPSGDHRESFDLRERGLLPVVNLVRVYALDSGLPELNTRDRLARLAEAGELSGDDSANLQGAFELIASLHLRHQAAQLKRGSSPDDFVSPEELSPFERRHLKDAFGIVSGMQSALAHRYPLKG